MERKTKVLILLIVFIIITGCKHTKKEINYVYTANIYDDNIAVKIGEKIPNNIETYQDYNQAIKALKTNYQFFIRHKLDEDIVSASYVGFIITNAMVIDTPSMTAGTYYLKGGDNGTAYNENKETLQSAIGNSSCHEYPDIFYCSVFNLTAYARPNGYVYIGAREKYQCIVDEDGNSYCKINADE